MEKEVSELSTVEGEVLQLAEEFALRLNFNSVDALRATAKTFKQMHLEQNCLECSTLKSALQDGHKGEHESLASNLYQNGRRSFRKSRKSVCVLPKFVLSSESEGSENEAIESERDESPSSIKSQNHMQFLSDIKIDNTALETDSDETEVDSDIDPSNHQSTTANNFNESPVHVKRKKRVQAISSDDDDSNAEDNIAIIDRFNNFENISQSNHYVVPESSDDEHSLYLTPNDFKEPTKKKIIYDDDDDNNEDENENQTEDLKEDKPRIINIQGEYANVEEIVKVYSSDEENQFNEYLGLLNKDTIGVDDDSSSNDDMDEFIVDDDLPFKTPRPFPPVNNVLSSTSSKFNGLVTPKSASRNILRHIQTPKSVPGTPAYKREFNKIRGGVIKELFELFNGTIFNNKLPQNFQITWNNRMTKTAGFCYYSKFSDKRTSRIELSDKVIDCVERVRDTLIHELCHAATWIIDGQKAGHGQAWKHWAKRANKIHPDLPVISRCHQYEIHTKYTYQCNGCGQTFGRHSKSVKSSHVCARCGGIPELIQDNVAMTPSKTPNSYALFVKKHFATVKKSHPGLLHKDIMRKISEKYKASKLQENKENEF